MMFNLSWGLLLLIISIAGIKLKCSKKYTPDSFTDSLVFASTITLSVYALLFAIAIIAFNTFNINIKFPSDDASLVVVLIYGSAYSLLSLKKENAK